jgi:predicted nucleotidyltransferase
MVSKELNVKTFSALLRKSRLLKKYGIKKVSLFGSFIKGKSYNDIDILVEDARDYDALLEFKQELETLTNKKIDLVIEKFANPIVLYRARKDLIDVTGN